MDRLEFEDVLEKVGFKREGKNYNFFHSVLPYVYMEYQSLLFKVDEVAHDFSNVYELKYKDNLVTYFYLDCIEDILYNIEGRRILPIETKDDFRPKKDCESVVTASLMEQIVDLFE